LVNPGEVTHEAPKIFREDCKINWELPAKKIHDHIRGLSPYPAAWTNMLTTAGEEIMLKIYRSEFIPSIHSHKAGTILTNFTVAADGGMIRVLEIQAPGKKKMRVEDFLRGFVIEENSRLE
jgi:methionyl-tRNA formyltransferase